MISRKTVAYTGAGGAWPPHFLAFFWPRVPFAGCPQRFFLSDFWPSLVIWRFGQASAQAFLLQWLARRRWADSTPWDGRPIPGQRHPPSPITHWVSSVPGHGKFLTLPISLRKIIEVKICNQGKFFQVVGRCQWSVHISLRNIRHTVVNLFSHCCGIQLCCVLRGRQGLLHGWVQQNHDGLPQKAGFPQERINEIHGSWYDPGNPVTWRSGEAQSLWTKKSDEKTTMSIYVLRISIELSAFCISAKVVKYSGTLHNRSYPWMREDAETADLCLVLGTSLGGLNADQDGKMMEHGQIRSVRFLQLNQFTHIHGISWLVYWFLRVSSKLMETDAGSYQDSWSQLPSSRTGSWGVGSWRLDHLAPWRPDLQGPGGGGQGERHWGGTWWDIDIVGSVGSKLFAKKWEIQYFNTKKHV